MTLFVDAEDALADLLAYLTPREVVSRAADIPDVMPLIRATRIGGADDRVTDRPRVELVVYAATRTEARLLAERARERLLDYPHRTTAGVVDHVVTEVGPHESWTADPQRVRRWRAVYRISVRRNLRG